MAAVGRQGSGWRVLAVAACALGAWAASAADFPVPKVMSDAPPSEGKWKMELLEMPGGAKADLAKVGGGMMLCTTAAKAMSRDSASKPGGAKSDCQATMVEDTPGRAVMEVSCPSSGTAHRTTITRVAARSYEMTSQNLKKPAESPMRARMSYVGACAAGDSTVSFDKDSPACQQIRGKLPEMEKAKAQCAQAGANRASCEQMLNQQIAQLAASCGGK